jgi:hypothetical protein
VIGIAEMTAGTVKMIDTATIDTVETIDTATGTTVTSRLASRVTATA